MRKARKSPTINRSMTREQVESLSFLDLWELVQDEKSDTNFRQQRRWARNEIVQRHGELTIIKERFDPLTEVISAFEPRLFVLTFYRTERGANTKVIDRYSTYQKAYTAWIKFESIRP
jgi:hypothetical protein